MTCGHIVIGVITKKAKDAHLKGLLLLTKKKLKIPKRTINVHILNSEHAILTKSLCNPITNCSTKGNTELNAAVGTRID